MIDNERQLKEVIEVLNKEGVLTKTILIGSWCLLFYKHIFEDFDALIRTTDIDFYVPNPKSFNQKNELVSSFKNINYDATHDTLTHKTTFISPDKFEIEFLTKLNRNQLPCVQLGNTTIYAESLSYVEIFSFNYIEVDYFGITLKVASPVSFVLQKLLINKDRKSDYKKTKDLDAVRLVLSYIKLSPKYKQELMDSLETCPKKWKKIILQTAEENNIFLD